MRFNLLQSVAKPINFRTKDTISFTKLIVESNLLFDLMGKCLYFEKSALAKPIVILKRYTHNDADNHEETHLCFHAV